jgi:ligand-binding sensor domain-containing protein/tetratricopeptide (TPR) repeat protein
MGRIRPAWFLALALLLASPAESAPFKVFTRSDGLPGSRINCLFEDRNGEIWAGTDQGAARYDGSRWTAVSPAGSSSAGAAVHSILQDAAGNFWFGTEGGISRFDGRSWDRLGMPEGLPRGGRLVAARDAGGTIWMGGVAALHQLDLERTSLVKRTDAPFREITSLYFDGEGSLWMTSAEGAARLDGDRWETFVGADKFPRGPVRGMWHDRAGTWWLATAGGLVEYNGVSFRTMRPDAYGIPPEEILCVTGDAAGRPWIGTPSGPAVFDGFRWHRPAGVETWPDRRTGTLLIDRGGNLWAGTDNGVVFANLAWEAIELDERAVPAHPVLTTSAGELWYAIPGGAAHRQGRMIDEYGARQEIGTLTALLEDSRGEIWLGSDRGLHRFDGRRFEHHPPAPAVSSVVDRGNGLFERVTTRTPDVRQGLTGPRVACLLEDARGRVWAGTGEGLSAIDTDGRWEIFEGPASPSGAILSLARAPGSETVWVGAASGLWRFDGRWTPPADVGGPKGVRVTALMAEADGTLWAGTDEGLWLLRDDAWRRFRQEEGLVSDRVTTIARAPGGILWIGTASGIALFNGADWSGLGLKEGLPAPVVRTLDPRPDGTVIVAGESWAARYRVDRVPPGTIIRNPPAGPIGAAQYLFEFTGADLLTDAFDLFYSWRVDGGDWSPFRREPLVTVSDLANGTHTFEVRAMDRHLNVDPTPAVAMFEVNTALFDVEVRELKLEELFASLSQYYAGDFPAGESPVGTIVLRNRFDRPLKVKLSVMIPGWMDFSTDRVVGLKPGEEAAVPLRLELNEALLGQKDDVVAQMLFTLQYHVLGELKENRFTRGLTIRGRNAMTWRDPRRIGVFINHLDPDVERLAHWVVSAGKPDEEEYVLDNNLMRAMLLFDALGALGIRYVADPERPYVGVAGGGDAVDHLRYPRETLSLGSGDCDDLAILYAALLQSIGLDTALVDVGDHVLVLVDLGLRQRRMRLVTADPGRVFPDEEERFWIPVETTLAGKPFADAWNEGIRQVKRLPLTIIRVKDAWRTYPPVPGGAEIHLTIPSDVAERAVARARTDFDRAEDALLGTTLSRLRRLVESAPDRADAHNRMGIALARKGYFRRAERHFAEVIRLLPGFPGGYSNLANLHYERGELASAVGLYRKSLEIDPGNSQVLIELALTCAEMGDFAAAREYYLLAVKIDPTLALPAQP